MRPSYRYIELTPVPNTVECFGMSCEADTRSVADSHVRHRLSLV